MKAIYLKSKNGDTIVTLRGKDPQMPEWARQKGYTLISRQEFLKTKRKIIQGGNVIYPAKAGA
jgi:hypothetical protein